MLQLINLIVLIISALGVIIIFFKKIPILIKLPEADQSAASASLVKNLYYDSIEKVKKMPVLKSFLPEVFLQKTLFKIRILSLKTDNKTSNWIQRLKERSQKKKIKENDNYWEELKKTTKHNK